MIKQAENTEAAGRLFEGWQETLIWSCLQGIMGNVYINENEDAAMAVLGDFCFFAGVPDREMVLFKPEKSRQEFIIMVPQSEGWGKLIEECYRERAKKVSRYAVKKEPGIFDREKLTKIVSEFEREKKDMGWELRMMDEELYHRCRELDWCRDFVSQYETYDKYKSYGMGVLVLKEGEIVAGASSYSGYAGGIEIEIDTREDYRRQGLAYVCGAKLILECLKRGWYPSWDAQNPWSASLAQKLGYHLDGMYDAYEIWGY